ncbi:MAG TPA: ribonuclease HII, partial [Allosphingosinicella sp.]
MARPCFKLEKVHPDPVAGVDEAGCAPLAGPVVAAAVILDREKFPRGIDDSKALPAEKREAIYARLTKVSAWGVGIASVEEIDRLNIYWARMLAMVRAVEALGIEPAMVLVDGNRCPKWDRPSVAIVDGDAKCRSIAAASIVA